MKTFFEYMVVCEEFRNSSTIANKPVYVRKEGEIAYSLAEDVFTPNTNVEEIREDFLKKLKLLRNAALPEGWKGMTS